MLLLVGGLAYTLGLGFYAWRRLGWVAGGTNVLAYNFTIGNNQNATGTVYVTGGVQISTGGVDGSYTNNLIDGPIVFTGSQTSITFRDLSGATNIPSRFYRVRLVP